MSASSPWPGRIATGLSILLFLLFASATIPKVAQMPFEVEAFKVFGLPVWLMVLVGVFEAITAVLLVIPRTTTLGAIMGVGIMIPAVGAHVAADEGIKVLVPIVLIALLIWLGWHRRAAFADWIAPHRG